MKNLLAAVALAILASQSVFAGVAVEQVDGDLYFLQYQMGRGWQMAAPGVAGLMDSKKKADKKIGKHLHRVCVEEGYGFFYEVKPADIMRDDTLKSYFEMYAGGKFHEQREFGEHNMRANIAKRFVYFSTDAQDGYERCVQ